MGELERYVEALKQDFKNDPPPDGADVDEFIEFLAKELVHRDLVNKAQKITIARVTEREDKITNGGRIDPGVVWDRRQRRLRTTLTHEEETKLFAQLDAEFEKVMRELKGENVAAINEFSEIVQRMDPRERDQFLAETKERYFLPEGI